MDIKDTYTKVFLQAANKNAFDTAIKDAKGLIAQAEELAGK